MAFKLEKPLGRKAYTKARILDPASGWDKSGYLVTDGEKIADLSAGDPGDLAGDIEVIDCEGFVLAPGLVDMRVHLGEPGNEHKGTLQSAGEAATAGGITTMACLPNTLPVIDDMSIVEFVARRARLLGLTKVHAYGAVTKGCRGKELAEMGMLAEAGAVAFSDATKAVANAQVFIRALSYAATFGLLVVQHPEEPSLAAGGDMNAGELATRLGLAGIPPEAEVIMVERDIRLAAMTGARLHFAHVSTAKALEAIRHAKEQGLSITCDTAPPYFALNETSIGDYRTFAKLSPPLRSDADRQAVVQAIADGTVDAIASDHQPEDEESKRLPFSQAAFGGVGLETLLAVSLDLVHNDNADLMTVLARLTCQPADLLGLNCGRLEIGRAADLCLFDPDRAWQVDADRMISKSKNTPFDGKPVQGRVLRTVIDGRTVFRLA